MELLLNLFWLLLTIPALWLWREGRRMQRVEAYGSRHFLLILGCLLVLLFPVISASDDLRAVRLDAEDPASQDTLRGCSEGKSPQPAHDGSHSVALPAAPFIAFLGHPVWRASAIVSTQRAGADLVLLQAGRSPPLSSRG